MIDDKVESEKFIQVCPKLIYLLCESGSGTYGCRTEHSDLDIRGVFVEDVNELLKIEKPKPDYEGMTEDRKIDWVMHDIEKFLKLLINGNFNMMEWVFTPIVYLDNTNGELKEIAVKSFSRQIGNHARGWAYSIYKMDWSEPKKCLYAIRPLMAYINLIETKQFTSDINKLGAKFGLTSHIDRLKELNERRLQTSEIIKAENLKIYDDLVKLSNEKEKDCWLPVKSKPIDDANRLLLNLRKEMVV
jgi:predicted nucleotidyltransferase